jgi:integrase
MGRRRHESHIYSRPDSRVLWCWYYTPAGKLVRRSTRCTTQAGAKAALAQFERAARDPSYAAAHKTTLGAALAELVRERRDVRGRAEGTVAMYVTKSGHLKRVLGADTPLGEVGARDVDRYVTTRLEEGASRSTISRELTTLRGALKLARRRREYHLEIDEVMPAFSAEYVPRKRALSIEEVSRLLAELDPDKAARVAFLIATACRWGESDRARREDIGPNTVVLRGTKTKLSARTVPVLPKKLVPMIALLEHATKHGQGSGGRLFGRWTNVRRDIAAACDRAGIARCSPNDLRRTMARWLRAKGVAPQLIGAFLGHADGRMVERVYGRLEPAELLAAMTGEHRESTVRKRGTVRGEMGSMGKLPMPRNPYKDRCNAVPRDRIELPTRGFSIRPTGACSVEKDRRRHRAA